MAGGCLVLEVGRERRRGCRDGQKAGFSFGPPGYRTKERIKHTFPAREVTLTRQWQTFTVSHLIPGSVPLRKLYVAVNRERGDFDPWLRVAPPPAGEPGHRFSFVGCSQWHECGDGTILMPAGHAGPEVPGRKQYPGVTVVRCAFDGGTFECLEHGGFPTEETVRGLAEPSLTRWKGMYLLTVRHDERAYVAASGDGLHYGELRPWTFDDGSDLGNYNTQQHWLPHGDALYLVYNRRSELNNGVV